MVSVKQEVSSWDDTKMISIKQELPNWDDPYNIDIDWSQDYRLQFVDLPTSEFLTSAAEFEQTYGASSFSATGWDQQETPKVQIRNHDCMWSGTCFDQSHPGKMSCGSNHETTGTTNAADPPVAANKFNTVTAVAAASLNNNVAATQKPILTPSNTLNINNNIPKITTLKTAQIPAGRSLLINPRMKQQQQTYSLPSVSTSDFLRDRDTTALLHTRPDTPLSLDEDPPEFKHNIDLATCTIGSNRLSLTSSSRHYSNHQHHHDDPSSHRIINMLKEQLEDTESGSLRTCMTSSSGEIGSLTDLLNDLEEIEGDDAEDSHCDDLDSDTDSNADHGSSKGGGIPGGHTHAHHQEMTPSSSSSSASSSPASYEYQGTHVGDHSYTRPKDRYHLTGLGVQTPSDSEEEIDVVSIGEKNLPTNPTPRDRRALQNRVAHKIARKQSQTVPPAHHHRRRHSDDGYASHQSAPSSASHSSPGKSYGYSPNYLTPASSTTISGSNTPLPGSSGSSNSRKRPSKDDRNGKNRHHQHRSKKQRVPGGKSIARAVESSEELETLEKRNLHNDMERQRRIGLKNLFEELKRQIPNLRDKERAPKVNILREAATLCTRLNREQEQLNALRKQQQRLYARVRQLRTSLHSHRRVMD